MSGIAGCHLIDLPKIVDDRGALSFVQSGQHIDFVIRRIYYLYDVPAGSKRGAHAHKTLRQLILPISGNFEVIVDDGQAKTTYRLENPACGLYVCPGIWRDIVHFSAGAVCLVLASAPYDEDDYIHDYLYFQQWAAKQ